MRLTRAIVVAAAALAVSATPAASRPFPGADETVNVPYDIGGRRL